MEARMNYKYIFGPVRSRRLSLSLGIDLVLPKICTLDCVYCESGKTTQLVMERKEYIPTAHLIHEIEHYFSLNDKEDQIRCITLSGAGEPTLASNLEEILIYLAQFRAKKGKTFKTAVITNSTLLYDPLVRKELLLADMVCPSLDTLDEPTYQSLKKPHKEATLARVLEGLKDFSQEYRGFLSLEIFLLKEYNDKLEKLLDMKETIESLNVDEVFLNTLDRPGVLENLKPCSFEDLLEIQKKLALPYVKVPGEPSGTLELKVQDKIDITTIEQAIIAYVRRRPATLEDFLTGLSIEAGVLDIALDNLMNKGILEASKQERGYFYHLKRFS